MVKMVATDQCPARHGMPGQEIDVSTNCVRFFREMGWAITPEQAKHALQKAAAKAAKSEAAPPAPAPAPATAAAKQATDEQKPAPAAEKEEEAVKPAAETRARAMKAEADPAAEYERLTGHKASPRWKPETLARKVEEARGGRYKRRDMRGED